jgi:uncharacterized caspase-like protein
MKKKALLVGINYPGTKSQLNGCVNDVLAMRQMLTRFGFKNNSHVRMLTDEAATTLNILDRLEWLVKGAKPGDVLFFHYSGHGSQVADTNYDDDIEPDGLDEIICPVDLDWRTKIIKDDDFKRIFSTVPMGVNLTVVLDCCHSGDGLRGFENPNITPSPNKSRLLPTPIDISNRFFGKNLQSKTRGLTYEGELGILISGCQSNQTSADAWIHNKYQGAATYYLLDSLEGLGDQADYETLVKAMNVQMDTFGYTQNPELNCKAEHRKRPFLKSFHE